MLTRPLTRWQKLIAFISKPSKLALIDERVDQWNRTKQAEKESARLKEWALMIFDQANRGANSEQLKALLGCAVRGLTFTEVMNFNKPRIPEEVQK